MKNGKCPKCGETDIIKVGGNAEAYGEGNYIQCGMTNRSMVDLDRYVCCNCGFIEEWVDTRDIEKIKKAFGSGYSK